jgi:bifunctional N-acetylglucosamine-1-phosphate-uridyltransferase/glucosamine-1-phosphate-acetyltransferase GlmU-like protein
MFLHLSFYLIEEKETDEKTSFIDELNVGVVVVKIEDLNFAIDILKRRQQ